MIEWITNIDLSILEFIQKNIRCDFLDAIVPPITHLAEKGIFWIAVALILICFKKTRKTGFMVGAALLIGLALGNGVLKNVVGRIRPYDLDGSLLKEADLLVSGLSDFSFPSGHTLASFEAATVLLIRDKRMGIPALVLAILIALTRLYLYVHYPTDVIAGVIFGVAFAVLGVFVVNKIYKALSRRFPNIEG
jgi:undecaprenyl-diphosphatase